jgi:hypothetical protein
MPINIEDPDGKMHAFADGTPDHVINAEMSRRWAAKSQPQAAPPSPLQGPGQMPPGTVPSTMTAKPTIEADMVPLSNEAQRAQKLMLYGAISGNKTMEATGKALWEQDPTAEARKKQSIDMGANAARRAEMKSAGENILKSYAKLLHTFDETPEDILHGAIGPYNTKPYMSHLPLIGGMTPPEAAAAYRLMPGGTGSPNVIESYNKQKLLGHLVGGVTNALMANAGKGLNMSDTRQKSFEAALQDFMHATDKKSAAEILNDARAIIQNDFGLSPEHADKIVHTEIERVKAEKEKADSEKKSGAPSQPSASGPPKSAIDELKANAGNPAYVQSFNKHFNSGKPGLAESLIGDAPAVPNTEMPAAPIPRPVAPAQDGNGNANPDAPHNLLRRMFGLNPI